MREVEDWNLGGSRLPAQKTTTRRLQFLFRVVHLWSRRLPSGVFVRTNQILIDAIISSLSIYLAYQIRFDGSVPPKYAVAMWGWVIALPVFRIAVMVVRKAYDTIWRYFNLQDAIALTLNALPPTLLLLLMRFTGVALVPIGAIVAELMVFLSLAGGIRMLRRASFELEMSTSSAIGRRRVVLVGSEHTLAGAIRQVGVSPDMEVVGLLSPDSKLHGLRIAGFMVVDDPSALPGLLATKAIDLVLIADPRLTSLGEIVATCLEFGVEARLLPSAAHVVRGDVKISALVNPDMVLADRTWMSPAAEPHELVSEVFRDRVVLITGAGGSIGSELARQVTALPVSSVILLDHDENSVFEIHGELAGGNSVSTKVIPVVCSVRDRAQLTRIFHKYRPQIVLHAAAYKHVPMMEHNPCEAVLNNVGGTREVLDLAHECEAERFLMISTDKAVEPTSVMGATKKIAEMLVQARAKESCGGAKPVTTRCACVRFGNVVGSRGSVIPIFLRQIAAGGPITVTHEQMTRYLITIPEAVQLVLQAATLGSDGSIYMLHMGDPVKITELARKLIEASGLNPDRDIEIRFVGLRPGEKIHEQLWMQDARVSETQFKRVLVVEAGPVPEDFAVGVRELEQAALDGDEDLVRECLYALPIRFKVQAA